MHENTYNAIYSHFQSRGMSTAKSEDLAVAVITASKVEGYDPLLMLGDGTYTSMPPELYRVMNVMRTVSDQQQIVSDINNSKSLQSRSIGA